MATNTDFRVKNGLYVGENINVKRGSVSADAFYGNLFDISTSGALGTGSSDTISGSDTLNFEAVSGVKIAVSDNNLQFSLSLSNSFEIDSNNIDLSDTGISAGTYGSQTSIPTFIVNEQGRLTSAAEVTIATTLSTGAGTGTGTVDLLSESLSVIGTSNEITTVASNNTVTVGLPNDVTIGNDLTVTGDFSVNTLLTVLSGDNVGIDTVSPNEKLTVSGNISATGTVYADAFNSKTGSSTIDFNDNVDLDGTLTVSSTISGNNNLFIDGSTTIRGAVTLGNASGDIININGQTINVPNIVAGTDNTVVIYNGSSLVTDEIDSRVWETSLIDNNSSSGTANRVTKWVDGNSIVDSQIIEVSGKVGICNSNPNEALTVSGNISATGTVYADAFNSKTGGSAISFNDDITLDGDITSTTGNFTTSLSSAALSGDGRALTTNSTISLAGDLGGSVALNNLDGTKTLTATIQANSVALGTDTTGNYVQSLALNTTTPSLTGSSLAAAEGNTITGLGLSATGVTANSYGSSTVIPIVTVLEDGRISSASTTTVATTLSTEADTGTGTLALLTDKISIKGTTNEVDTNATGRCICIGLPSAVLVTTSLSSPLLSGTNLHTDGKVGICNSNPNHALSVTGNISATGDAFVDGDLTVAGEVTYTASTVTATTTAFQDNFLLESTDSGSSGAPDITLYRNSSSPANDDDLGNILFRGRNNNSQDVEYAQILTDIIDVADGSEDAKIRFLTMTAGTLTDTLAMDRGEVGIGTIDPSANLHIYGTGEQSLYVGSSNASRAIIQLDGAANGDGAGGDYAYLAHEADGSFDIKNLQNNSMNFSTGSSGSTRMTITSAGDILPGSDNTEDLGSPSKRWSNVYANCTTTGAVIESNLCTSGLDSCPEGSVVIWRENKLQGTTDAYSHRVMGVTAPGSESPIVMGAENILVTGYIEEGDPIVTSDKYNHGMRGDRSEALHGKVIAEALESGAGKSYIIRGMIRKF